MTSIRRTLAAAASLPVLLSGCYVVPTHGDGGAAYVFPAGAPGPAVLQARLYPANELATQTGALTGTVTNLMTGKGRLQLDYQGERLAGEATRVAGEERRGVASAVGPRGTFINCEYQMNTPYQGSGTCAASSGARYQVHIGS
jgi:hypothetical protein